MNQAIAVSLLTKLVRLAAMWVMAWMVSKGWLKAPAAESAGTFLGDYYPEVGIFLVAVGWDLWAHVKKAAWIVRVKTIMGQINPNASPDATSLQDAKATVAKVVAAMLICSLTLGSVGCALLKTASTAPAATAVATAGAKPLITQDLAAAKAEIQKLATAAKSDINSPAGKQIIAAVEKGALNIGADVATGNDVGAAIAGGEAVAAALEAYSGLPTSSSATLATVTKQAAGVATVATDAVPALVALINSAQASGLSQATILQAVAQGLYTVRSVTAP